MNKMKRVDGKVVGEAVLLRVGANEILIVGPSVPAVAEVWGRICPNLFLDTDKMKQVEIGPVIAP